MSRRFVRWGRPVHWLVRFSLLLSLMGCSRLAEPTRMPTRTPLPTPDDLAIYVMLTERYTAPYVIMQIENMSADDAARILRALQAVEPPARAAELHQQVLDAYQQVCAGKLLLSGADSELRADAYFMIDWGISRLVDYHDKLERLRR